MARLPWLLAACLGALSGCAHAPGPLRADLAIVGATVIDTRDGARLPDQTVLVAAGRVLALGPRKSLPVSPGTPIVDAAGRFLIPGLWDMHAHTLWDPVVRGTSLPMFVAHGVTGVRDMGGTLEVMAQVRAERSAGWRPWPRIVAAGQILDGPEPVDPSISRAIATPEEARAAVATLAAAGVDFIKVYTLLPPDAYRAVVDEARRHGLAVAGHVPHGIDAREAASGMRSIEHLRAETGGLCADLAPADCNEVHAALRAHHVWQTPTLVARRQAAFLDSPAFATDPRLASVPAVLRGIWLENRTRTLERLGPQGLAARREAFARQMAEAGALPALGIPVLAGSDAGADFVFAGSGLHEELQWLVDAGLTPLQALQAATLEPARYFGRDDIGRVSPGALADLVLLDANPLADIGNVSRIHGVVLDGRWLDRAALDALVAGAEAAAGGRRPPTFSRSDDARVLP